jgi:hypothetical protein
MNPPQTIVSALLLIALGTAAGCTASVRPSVSESEFMTDRRKVNASVMLVSTEAFRNHSVKRTDLMDMKGWQFEIGPAASDTFRYTLASRFVASDVRPATPAYPLPSPAPRAVVVPSIVQLKSTQPIVFKFENYGVTVTLDVDVFDSRGTRLYSRTYTGSGKKQGAIGQESAGHAAFPEACRQALRQAIDAAVDELVLFVETGSVPADGAELSPA